MDHETSLRFDNAVSVSNNYRDLLRRLLTNRELRLGRQNVMELMEHPFFESVNWPEVGKADMPSGVHIPQFAYSTPATGMAGVQPELPEESQSQPFTFSAFFQSSPICASPGISILRSATSDRRLSGSSQGEAAFIGFSWGPSKDAFPLSGEAGKGAATANVMTPRPLGPFQRSFTNVAGTAPPTHLNTFATPIRPHNVTAYHTLPRPSTLSRTAARRAVSDREAMKQLVDCIGMSARKKVLASGRKPRVLDSFGRNSSHTLKRELRFGPPAIATNNSYNSTDFPPVQLELEGSESGSEGPPSPSPSPRPGSAMSSMSRRSVTPTTTLSYSSRLLTIPSTSESIICQNNIQHHLSADCGDKAISRLEERHSHLMSQLGEIQARLDNLRTLVDR
ncbi:hypothetical protein ID866_7262 [Astraeus odoratus]|nr:hypothetical protein ID866_7262 [Astraeus odoratus]